MPVSVRKVPLAYQRVWKLVIIIVFVSLTWKQTDWSNQTASRRHIDLHTVTFYSGILGITNKIYKTSLIHVKCLYLT